jgi:hypothetical protein
MQNLIGWSSSIVLLGTIVLKFIDDGRSVQQRRVQVVIHRTNPDERCSHDQ